MRIRLIACVVLAVLTTVTLGAQPRPRLTAEKLASLKSSSNDPSGDFFADTPENLAALIDAFVADNSMVSPMYLIVAANTAFRMTRVEDAAFLFYAGQIRAKFDFDRYDISSRADGNNAATYLGFLIHTTGQGINPAIQSQPKQFATVIQRIETWEVVPSPDAFYPEFEEAKGFKLPREQWPTLAQSLKADFLDRFGRRYVKLLNDPEYFKAFKVLQDANVGPIAPDETTLKRVDAAMKTMEEVEARFFPGPTDVQRLRELSEAAVERTTETELEDPPAQPLPAEELPMRVGGKVPKPRKIKHVEPDFPAGTRGSMVVELTINRVGRVEKFDVLRGDFGLVPAAEAAIRQWEFEPVMVDGKPVAVLQAFTITAK